MKIRIVLLSLILTLAGCSSMGSWFGFGHKIEPISGDRIGNLPADTPFNQQGLSLALGDDYRLLSGMRMKDNQLVNFFQAIKENDGQDQIAQIIYGQSDSGIVKVEVFETGIGTSEAEIGTPFGKVYQQAFGACERDASSDKQDVICRSAQYDNVDYVFSGQWSGPGGLMPDNDALKTWQVSKIIWNKQKVANPARQVIAQPEVAAIQRQANLIDKPIEVITAQPEVVSMQHEANSVDDPMEEITAQPEVVSIHHEANSTDDPIAALVESLEQY